MKLPVPTIAVAALAAVMLSLPAVGAQTASLQIGLVVHDSCRIAHDGATPGLPVGRPEVRCELRHPYRIRLHKASAGPSGRDASSVPVSVRDGTASRVWLVEF